MDARKGKRDKLIAKMRRRGDCAIITRLIHVPHPTAAYLPARFVEPSPFTDPDAAARKLVEIANAPEAARDGRVYIELINGAFLKAGGTPDQYRVGIERAIASGWLCLHQSGTYVKFTPAGAELFA